MGVGALAVEQGRESPAGEVRLLEEILSRENLLQALQRVKSNRGAPGSDGMTVKELPQYLKAHWPCIREEILNGRYTPVLLSRTRKSAAIFHASTTVSRGEKPIAAFCRLLQTVVSPCPVRVPWTNNSNGRTKQALLHMTTALLIHR